MNEAAPPSLSAPSESFRSGFVALLGEPNVGKSTLLNALLDFKVAIVSPKPQTTRDRIFGIRTDETCQIVFVDTPGVMEPHDRFNEYLRDRALEALRGVDVVYRMIEPERANVPLPPAAAEALARCRRPVFLVVNKCDLLDESKATEKELHAAAAAADGVEYAGVFRVSALERTGLDSLIEATRFLLPEGPPLYDPEQMTDRDLRFLAAEIVREKVLAHTAQEIPYAVATRTEEFREREGAKHFVCVTIHVEHESQKPILIGAGGAMLKKIGSEARPDIEQLCGHPVFLELRVKVRKNWRKNEDALREFGFRPEGRGRQRRRKA
ncbi:GTPase Era [Candidatus Sumerlaeota bacterium]|nr:GTPase Era [Candidatus Sumerlaeota bacterium]